MYCRHLKFGLFFTVLGFLALPVELMSQGVVLPRERRSQTLETLERLLHPGEWKRDLDVWPESPFHRKVVRTTITRRDDQESVDEPDEPPPPPPRLDDRAALERIAREFRPAGAIILGQLQAVQFRNGAMMRVGDSFRARIRDESYTVILKAVTLRDYTLQLGEAAEVYLFESTPTSAP